MITDYKYFLFSEHPDKLVRFYIDCLGFHLSAKLQFPDDYGYALQISPGERNIWLAKHSEVTGKNKDSYRTILNLSVDSVQNYFDKAMKWPGVEVVAEPFPMNTKNLDDTSGRWVATILDPEGNCVQFMGPLDLVK
ncbi:MAG TPA: VOC family protein [Candidatus Nitrosocosmicus sp.]|nr:VOC family protein [Candidatus Nitrosocosmicus sp.]